MVAPSKGEIGGPETSMSPISGGSGTLSLTEEDYIQDLTGFKLYDSDSQIKAALSVIILPVKAA